MTFSWNLQRLKLKTFDPLNQYSAVIFHLSRAVELLNMLMYQFNLVVTYGWLVD